MRAQVLTLSGPIQREIHTLIASYFTKEKTEALRPVMERIVEDVLVDLEGRSEFDVVASISKRVPIRTVACLLGLPAEVCPKLVEWTDIVECVPQLGCLVTGGWLLSLVVSVCREWYGGSGDFATRCAAAQNVVQAFEELVAPIVETARSTPSGPDSITTSIVYGAANGRFPSKHVIPNLFFLVAAGQETTAALISSAVLSVLTHSGEASRVSSTRCLWVLCERGLRNVALCGQTLALQKIVKLLFVKLFRRPCEDEGPSVGCTGVLLPTLS